MRSDGVNHGLNIPTATRSVRHGAGWTSLPLAGQRQRVDRYPTAGHVCVPVVILFIYNYQSQMTGDNNRGYPHGSFHIGPYIKPECRYQAPPRADID